jgi:sulfur-carrier protein adenylyltransferase/sulfurtransferase
MFALLAVGLFLIIKGRQFMVPKDAVVTPKEAQDWIKNEKGLQILDVRSPAENSQARLAGSKLIPVGELAGRLKELEPARPVLVYCASGNRSAMALAILRKNGFPGAKHLEGGISSWQAAGLPVER